MPRRFAPRWRTPVVIATIAAAFASALVVPIPTLPDGARAVVRAEVSERLPGWTIGRVDPSWEGGYTVVTQCAGKQVSFQFVPGHGLPARDAWLHPSNEYARERLESVSDHWRYLLWRADPDQPEELSCRDELARSGSQPADERNLD